MRRDLFWAHAGLMVVRVHVGYESRNHRGMLYVSPAGILFLLGAAGLDVCPTSWLTGYVRNKYIHRHQMCKMDICPLFAFSYKSETVLIYIIVKTTVLIDRYPFPTN